MSADRQEMRHLKGKDFLADTEDPNSRWTEKDLLAEDRTQILHRIEDAICHKRIFEIEHRVIRQNGTIGWTCSRAVPSLNKQSEIVDWFGTAKDVTKGKPLRKQRESDVWFCTLMRHAMGCKEPIGSPVDLSKATFVAECHFNGGYCFAIQEVYETWNSSSVAQLVSQPANLL